MCPNTKIEMAKFNSIHKKKKEWNKIFLIPYFHDNSVSLSFSLYSGLIEEQIKTKG